MLRMYRAAGLLFLVGLRFPGCTGLVDLTSLYSGVALASTVFHHGAPNPKSFALMLPGMLP